MSPETAAAIRKAKSLAALIDSSTFDGERSNAIDAYFRICEKHRLDTATLQPVDAAPSDGSYSYVDAFWAEGSGGSFEEFMERALDAILTEQMGR